MSLTTAQRNDLFFQKVDSGNSEDMQKAASAVEEYTRTKMREDGFWRKILPPTPITNADLDRSWDSDRNRVIVDKEVDQGSAMSVPYGKLPAMEYILTDRYEVPIQRTMTKMYYKDISTFRTDRADVRQILANNLTKDMLAEEDDKAIQVVDYLVGQANLASAHGATTVDPLQLEGSQWVSIDDSTAGYPSREGFNDALKVLTRTANPLPCSTVLVNITMINDLQKWGLDELGSDLAGEIAIKGWAERNLLGKRLIVTIKRNLVGDLEIYMFAEPKFMGKFFTIEDTTIHMERTKGIIIEFYARKEDGCAIGNSLSLGKATFVVA